VRLALPVSEAAKSWPPSGFLLPIILGNIAVVVLLALLARRLPGLHRDLIRTLACALSGSS
jgi:hypothetical protein